MSAPKAEPGVRVFHARRFCLRQGGDPVLTRASGDSGFVSHLTASTHGATGWDWSFRLVKTGHDWAFISDGRLTVFVDEPGQYVPADAKPGDQVALRLPRARENLHPHRFTLNGGQGPVVVGHGFTKLFLPVTFEAASALVEAFASRLGDQLRFSLAIANSQLDFERADSAVLDVGHTDAGQVVKLLETFRRGRPDAFVARGVPFGTREGALGFAVAEGTGRADIADGFGWRRAHEAVLAGQT
jgi:hypothetical protein